MESVGPCRIVRHHHGLAEHHSEPGIDPLPNDELQYITDCMVDLGYTDPCGYVGVDQLNEAMKATYRGHWSWTSFILNANEFAGGSPLAYAYLGGPHTVATRGNGTLGTAHCPVIARMSHTTSAESMRPRAAGAGDAPATSTSRTRTA